MYVDWARIGDLRSAEEELPTDDSPFEGAPGGNPMEGAADALVAVPTFGLLLASFGAGFRLGLYGFVAGLFEDFVGDDSIGAADDVGPTETPSSGKGFADETPDIGSLERMVVTGTGIVLEGSFDLESVETAATEEGFEQVGEHRGAQVYENSDGGGLLLPQDLSFAAREDALVFGNSPAGDRIGEETPSEGEGVRSRVETLLDVEAGEARQLADRSDDAAWALGRAGHGHIAVGAWGDFGSDSKGGSSSDGPGFDGGFEGPAESLPTANGEAYAMTFSESEETGDMAASYPEGEVPDRETVESSVGNTADEQAVEIDGQRVSVSGTWDLENSQET